MKQAITDGVVFHARQVWQSTHAGTTLSGRGDQRHLSAPLTAFFASRQCPGSAIRAGTEWALEQARMRNPIVGGFHSPLERSVLELLLEAGSPVTVVLARAIQSAQLPGHWREALEQGHLVIVSAADTSPQITEQHAIERNDLVARLATTIVIAHASPGGGLEAQVAMWRSCNLAVRDLRRE